MTKFSLLAIFALATSTAFVSTAETADSKIDTNTTGVVKGAGAPKVTLLPYKSRLTDNGKIVVELDEQTGKKASRPQDVLTVFAPDVRFTEVLLHSQDWYLSVDPNGTMQGIYTVPRNQALPSSVLRSMGEGFGILKVNPSNSFFKVFPSKFQLATQLTSFMEAARETTCQSERRPESISATVDVKPGWSGAGKINFSATWAVKDLCRDDKKKS